MSHEAHWECEDIGDAGGHDLLPGGTHGPLLLVEQLVDVLAADLAADRELTSNNRCNHGRHDPESSTCSSTNTSRVWGHSHRMMEELQAEVPRDFDHASLAGLLEEPLCAGVTFGDHVTITSLPRCRHVITTSRPRRSLYPSGDVMTPLPSSGTVPRKGDQKTA